MAWVLRYIVVAKSQGIIVRKRICSLVKEKIIQKMLCYVFYAHFAFAREEIEK